MPGGCRGKKNARRIVLMNLIEECANFALGAGLMKQEEFEMFKKQAERTGRLPRKSSAKHFVIIRRIKKCALILLKSII